MRVILSDVEHFDVVVVGASFSGLSLAHHLPENLKVLVVDAKPAAGSTVESTGLITEHITEHTRKEFASFFDIDRHITNPITSICVIAPGFEDWFVSHTGAPWIYQTDTKKLIKNLADKLPSNVILKTSTAFIGHEKAGDSRKIHLLHHGKKMTVTTKFLVGADGGHSKVAASVSALNTNKKFLFGYEQVYFGEVHLGPHPEETIYHFWFGEFSLGYGGWLSPTVVEGKKAFRVGLAKLMKDRGDAIYLMKNFLQTLLNRKIVTIHCDRNEPDYVFGSHIPIGGMLKRIYHDNILLVGDAAGFCGAFAADGIKGSVISGKEGAKVIAVYLKGNMTALQRMKPAMNEHNGLLHYYKKQLRYRMIWDMMKKDRTFRAMYDIIEAEKEKFLDQFCDSKDKRKSLARTVMKVKHIPKLLQYGWYILLDLL